MKKGFTLVELLAVIVILAIIALITIPAVMKIIDNATMNSYRRSVDLYGKAVSQAIIEYQTDMVEKGQASNVTFDNIEPYIEYEGNEVDCKIKQIYSDKTILLTECYVDEELVLAEKNRGYSNENYYYYTNSKKKIKAIEYIKAVEEELKDKNITGTCTISEDKITCNGQDFTIKSNLENAISGTLTIENSKVKSYSNLKFATEKKTETNTEVPQVVDEQNTSNENGENNNNQTLQESIATDDDYRGYYADVDGNGTPDGVIYADLNKASESGAQYYNSNGAYTYPAKTNLNEYTISKEKYTEGKFGEKEIIKLKKDKGNPRFYVMALENFTTEAYTDSEDSSKDYPAYTSYYWYYGAYNHMSPLITSNDFGQGKENTRKMIAKWNAAGTSEGYTDSPQNNQDIWKHIQTKYQQGWYIPSRGEWAAFADYFTNKTDLETKLTTSNYNITYGLSGYYWSSSQYYTGIAWGVYFDRGRMYSYDVGNTRSVRLGVTF